LPDKPETFQDRLGHTQPVHDSEGLTKGQAIVAGVSINAPVMIRVRERYTSHGGVSRDAPSEWHKWLSLNSESFEEKSFEEKADFKPVKQKKSPVICGFLEF